jgi:DNA-binding MarR family transcriptional regulator
MGRRPSNKHTLGRKDNDGNYYSENCEWQLRVTQARNRRNNKLTLVQAREIRMIYNHRGYTQKELAEEFGINQSVISDIVNNKLWKEGY